MRASRARLARLCCGFFFRACDGCTECRSDCLARKKKPHYILLARPCAFSPPALPSAVCFGGWAGRGARLFRWFFLLGGAPWFLACPSWFRPVFSCLAGWSGFFRLACSWLSCSCSWSGSSVRAVLLAPPSVPLLRVRCVVRALGGGCAVAERVVGFSGWRALSGVPLSLLSAVAASACSSGCAVWVGCCVSGADAAVRSVCSSAGVVPRVFRASSSVPGAVAARSAALVRALAGVGGLLVSAPGVPCPAGVVPARSWRSGACPSGSWSSLALAVGLGVPVLVVGLPASSLPRWSGGAWVACSSVGAPCFAWRSSVLALAL